MEALLGVGLWKATEMLEQKTLEKFYYRRGEGNGGKFVPRSVDLPAFRRGIMITDFQISGISACL